MKSILKVILPLALLILILLASPGAVWQGEKTSISKNTSAPTGGGTLNREAVLAKAASLAVPFVPNAGRFNKKVLYSADLFSGRFFLTDKELVYSLNNSRGKSAPEKSLVFKEYFIDEKGGRISFKPEGEEKGMTKVSYFRGNDPANWQSGLASYKNVSLGLVYPGIEVKLKASGKNVEKIFYMSPRSDVAKIKIVVAGVQGLEIAGDGRLLFKNGMGELAMRAPVAWQEIDGRRHAVKVGYRLLGNYCYGFLIHGDYEKSHSLVIDPALDTLLASTYLGGNGDEVSFSLALDASGNIYLTGDTTSKDFPTMLGAYDREINPEVYGDPPNWYHRYPTDVFISKMDRNLTQLLASTFFGGDGDDGSRSMALDRAGNVYLAGNTSSADFPTTSGGYDRTYNGGSNKGDIFVSKLDSNLTKLLASTYLGGIGDDGGRSLALDSPGNVYLTGLTGSANFPTTSGAYDRTYNGGNANSPFDVFISKLDPNLAKLRASTYLGGTDIEVGNSLALDGQGNVFLAGKTSSEDFPTTPGAYDRTNDGVDSYNNGDVFISKLTGDLTMLLASTFLGGAEDDECFSLALGRSNNVYLTGITASIDFPTTPGALDRTFSGDLGDISGDAFISRLDNDLTALLSSTFSPEFNHGSYQEGNALVLDNSENVYVTGINLLKEGMDSLYGWVSVSKVNRNLSVLLASKYLGGCSDSWESGNSIALDSAGNVFVTGKTAGWIDRFPTTPGAFDRTSNGDFADIFISKLNGGSDLYITVISPNGGESWLAGTVHDITWVSSAKIADVRIELSADNGSTWNEVSVSPARYRTYSWTVPNTPSRQCLIRISDNDHPDFRDTSNAVFSILMHIDLLAERREARAFSIVRQYGRIQFLIGNASVPVAKYRIMRRKSGEDFALLKEIAPSQLQNKQFQMQDKYLEKGINYTYRVEAYDAAGQLVGISSEKTI